MSDFFYCANCDERASIDECVYEDALEPDELKYFQDNNVKDLWQGVCLDCLQAIFAEDNFFKDMADAIHGPFEQPKQILF